MKVPMDCKKGSPNPNACIYWCETCRFGQVLPMPSIEQVSKHYELETYYTQGASHFVEAGRGSFFDRLRVHVAWRLDKGRPISAAFIHGVLSGKVADIVDVGCGGGDLSRELVRLGHRVVGVEVDPNSVSRQAGLEFDVYAGTAENLPAEVADRKFDCVIMSHVLEHCRDPLAALKNARALLRPGGRFICEVPNNDALALEDQGCSWEMFDAPRHLSFFTRKSLTNALERSGFKTVMANHGYFCRQFDNSWIETERKLWRNLMSGTEKPSPLPMQNSRLRAWKLLARSFFASADRRYDSISAVAVAASN